MYRLIRNILITRLVVSLICPDALKLPENSKISLNELHTIPPKDIVECLSRLGREKLAIDEASYIWHSIIKFFNGIINIPENVLGELNYASIAIHPQDFHNIEMGTVDVITRFGTKNYFSHDQLEAVAARVREDFGFKQPKDYTIYDMAALSQILCAFKRSEIERIPPKAYKEAASIIGKLTNCNREVMQAFAKLAIHEDAFGPPTLWTNAIVQEVGTVVNFLPDHTVNLLKIKFYGNVSSDVHAF